jgi:hypothetical protein
MRKTVFFNLVFGHNFSGSCNNRSTAARNIPPLREAEISDRNVFAQPPDGSLIVERPRGVATDRFARDVETSAARQTVEFTSCLFLGESRPRLLAIPQVRRDPAPRRRFDDWFPRHLTPPKICPRISKRCNYQAERRFFPSFSPSKGAHAR